MSNQQADITVEVLIRPGKGRRQKQQQQQRRAVIITDSVEDISDCFGAKLLNNVATCRPCSELGPGQTQHRASKRLLRKDSAPTSSVCRQFQAVVALSPEATEPVAQPQVAARRLRVDPATFNPPELLPGEPLPDAVGDCMAGQLLLPRNSQLRQRSAGSTTPRIPSWVSERPASSVSGLSRISGSQQRQQQPVQVHIHHHHHYHTHNYTNCVINLPRLD